MYYIQLIFSYIGTELIVFLLGGVAGGLIWFKIAVRKAKINQKQKAGDNANQTQIGQINHDK